MRLRPPRYCSATLGESERIEAAMIEVPQPLNTSPQVYWLQKRVLGFSGLDTTYRGFDHNLDLSPKWSATPIREGGTGNR